MKISEVKGKVDFAIITIRDDEDNAVSNRLPKPETVEGHRYYRIYRVKAQHRTYLVALAIANDQGTGEAQNLARDIIEDLDPNWFLVVGIAGGVPDSDFTLGDVILSTHVYDLALNAAKEGKPREYAVRGGNLNKKAVSLIKILPNLVKEIKGWNSDKSIKAVRPTVDINAYKSKLYGDENWQKKVTESLEYHFNEKSLRQSPKVTTGPIASSDTLVKDTKTIQEWLRNCRDAKAIEMESAGIYRVANGEKQYPFIAIRGISDIVGLDRDPKWTEYACNSAAAFAISFIKSGKIESREESPVKVETNKTKPEDKKKRANQPNQKKQNLEAVAQIEPIAKKEKLYSNLLTVDSFSEKIYTAKTSYSDDRDLYFAFDRLNLFPDRERTVKSKILYSFHDLEKYPWNEVCEPGTIEEHNTVDWAYSLDLDKRNIFLDLIYRCLTQKVENMGLQYSTPFDYYYFRASADLSNIRMQYPSVSKLTSRDVFKLYDKGKDERFRHYRHSAFKGKFQLIERAWYLEITPTYHYTKDGFKLYWYYESLIRGIKQLEANPAVLGQAIMWAAYLRGIDRVSDLHYPFLKFGNLLSYEMEFGIEDSLWQKKEEIQKEDEENSLI